MNQVKVLFLAANPVNTPHLRLDEEIREITEKIRASDGRHSLTLVSRWATRPDDLIQALNEDRPTIVHFSGHGTKSGEIVLEDPHGQAQPVSKDALHMLFHTLADNIRVVVLNACYAQSQAEAITDMIDCTIGSNSSVSDKAATIFAASFYRAIGFGRSIQEAFDQGAAAVLLENVPTSQIPTLMIRQGVDPSNIILVGPSTILSRPLDIGRDSMSIDHFYRRSDHGTGSNVDKNEK